MSISAPTSFARLLMQGETDPLAHRALQRQLRSVCIALLVTGAVLALWATTAPLSGAVLATGKLKTELNRKTVQHQEGGLVREILVRDGQTVRAGQPLVVIGDVRTDAQLSLLQDQLEAERIRQARASAEAAFAPRFAAPADLADKPGVAGHVDRERALFEARRRGLDEHVAAVQAQVRDARAQTTALAEQIAATETSARLASEELQMNEKLVRDGFVQRARLLQLQRDEADYRGRLSETRSDLAVARQRIAELQARLALARNQYQQQATDEARESAARIRELEQQLRPSTDQAERQYVRAPVAGRVMALRVSAVGEAIGPRDAILDLVPTQEKIVVEARIRPQDVNHVHEQSAADVRLTGFDARTTPLLPGKVVFVSPDRITSPETGEAWYVATIEVDGQALAGHPELELQAGMPAELFVKTPARTLFQYLARPLNAFASRAMREP
ncbi:MAG TPA: HlyD family type I secretion periplasmic adaptor subunit [Steroidobacteraceae bacterium]|nr:HlyD family type I secretion periplasmic adaptor subunit [Steroidobacteraceae bacterium]